MTCTAKPPLICTAAMLAAASSHAGVIVDLPNGSDSTSNAVGQAVYEHEFAPIANASQAHLQSTGNALMTVRLTTLSSASIVRAPWRVLLKLDGGWELQRSGEIPWLTGINSQVVNLNDAIDSSSPLIFDQATLSGLRVELEPSAYPGSAFIAEVNLENNSSSQQLNVTTVPEPTSLALLGLGGLLVARRRRA